MPKGVAAAHSFLPSASDCEHFPRCGSDIVIMQCESIQLANPAEAERVTLFDSH